MLYVINLSIHSDYLFNIIYYTLEFFQPFYFASNISVIAMEDNRSALYRYYKGGILVYDSRARSPNETDPVQRLSKNSVSPELAKEIERCDPFGDS
jgi:hypothetical protein